MYVNWREGKHAVINWQLSEYRLDLRHTEEGLREIAKGHWNLQKADIKIRDRSIAMITLKWLFIESIILH